MPLVCHLLFAIFLYGSVGVETPVPVRSPKLSNIEPVSAWMGDHLDLPCLGTPGAVDFLANPQLPSVASMANPLGGPGRGSSLGSETHPAFIYLFILFSYFRKSMLNDLLRFGVKDKSWGR